MEKETETGRRGRKKGCEAHNKKPPSQRRRHRLSVLLSDEDLQQLETRTNLQGDKLAAWASATMRKSLRLKK